MATDIIHSCFGTFSLAIMWGGLAVVAAIFGMLLISESSSAVRPPGCQRGAQATRPLP
jgi:hypothetical protein